MLCFTMNDEVKPCKDCRNLEVLLSEKEGEIQKLKLQIQNLREFLHAYQNQSKLCQFCSVNGEFDSGNADKCEVSNLITETISYSKKNEDSFNSLDLKSRDSVNETLEKEDFFRSRNFCSNFSSEDNSPCVKNDEDDDDENNSSACQSTSENKTSTEDYVYDENFKMYYSISTGYYYDENSGLFYIPQTGAYYKYDYTKSKYELYESVQKSTAIEATEVCDSVLNKVNNLNISDANHSSPNSKPVVEKQTNTFHQKNYSCDSGEDEISCGSTKDWQPPEGSNVTVQDLVRDVAEQSSGMSDYIYDGESGMYYCKSTGYLYDPIKRLLYDPQTKNYYRYIQETLSYEFYCTADVASSTCSVTKQDQDQKKEKRSSKSKRKHWKKKEVSTCEKDEMLSRSTGKFLPEIDAGSTDEDLSSPEEGEIISSDSDEEELKDVQNLPTEENSAPVCPPCIRAIVKDSTKLKNGTLILITCTGAIIGRDKVNTVYVPDVSVSKSHAEIKFSNESWKYSIEDLGSQNGTFVNEARLSQPKQKSEPQTLNHGDNLSLGSCQLLLHIHEGYETCDNCEPGQVLAELSSQEAKPAAVIKTREEKEKERKQEMCRLKKKYGLKGMEYTIVKDSIPSGSGYEDKAEIRRKTVGSQNPYEKTEVASMEEVMPESNKGYQMLKKLGWKEGDSLGRTASGISEPIPLRPWVSKAGFGSTDLQASSQPLSEDSRKRKWVKAQERFLKLP